MHSKIHLGCGGRILKGFLNVDRSIDADVKGDAIEVLHSLPENSVEIIYSNAFLEHVERPIESFMQACFRTLSDDGIALHLGIPNFPEVIRCYMERRAGIVSWDGGVFGIENVSRYTHGTYDHRDRHHEWVHKDIYDADKLRRVSSVFPHVMVVQYHYPQEPYPLALGLLLGKRECGLQQFLNEPFVYGVDVDTLEFV